MSTTKCLKNDVFFWTLRAHTFQTLLQDRGYFTKNTSPIVIEITNVSWHRAKRRLWCSCVAYCEFTYTMARIHPQKWGGGGDFLPFENRHTGTRGQWRIPC